MEIDEHQWKLIENFWNRWKSMNIHENQLKISNKSMSINANQWKSTKIYEKLRKIHENQWKSMKSKEKSMTNRWKSINFNNSDENQFKS